MIREIQKILAPLKRRVQLTVSRAIVRLINDATVLQTLQVEALRGETLDGVERLQNYGFSSHPLAGAQAVLLALGGNRQHSIVIAVDDRRHRATDLDEGEVQVYTDQHDPANPHRIVLKSNRVIRIECGNSYIEMTENSVYGSMETESDDGALIPVMAQEYEPILPAERITGGGNTEFKVMSVATLNGSLAICS